MRPSFLIAAALACAGCYGNDPPPPTVLLTGTARAEPVCPVEQVPPDPSCAERPVEGAEIVVTDADGNVAAEVVTDADGAFTVSLPPGRYTLVPQPVAVAMGTAAPVVVELRLGDAPDPVVISYDTGIR
jgi:hypothetical protein